MNELTPEVLKELGLENKSFESYSVLTVDNGKDLMGTGATGDFVEKKYNAEKQEVERVPFEKRFQGIVISNKAMVTNVGKEITWKTGEFSTGTNNPIPVYSMNEGKIEKKADGSLKAYFTTYNELKAQHTTSDVSGEVKRNYVFYVILYIMLENEEVIKLKFKGSSRGNWFDFTKSLSRQNLMVHQIVTDFQTYMDKNTGKYAISFKAIKKDDKIYINQKQEEVGAKIAELYNQQKSLENKLPAPEATKQIAEQPTDPNGAEMTDQEIANVKEEEDDEALNPNNLPF